jgi:predicted nuclease with TOPRIM domain
MKPKDLSLGLCVAALLVSEILLFSANDRKKTAEANLRDAQHQADELRSQNEQLKADNAAAQATDIVSLRAENRNLSQKFSQLREDYARLDSTNKLLARQLEVLGGRFLQQQEQLNEWTNASLVASVAVQQETQEQAQARKKAAQNRDICINNLKEIDAAKQKWALVNNKTDLDVPTEKDLLSYLPGRAMPVCPSGGTYSINAVGLPPTCSIAGHAIQ